MSFYFETANKYAFWKENWVEFCNMTDKIRWFYKFFRENYITGKIVAGLIWRFFGKSAIFIPAIIFTLHNITRHN